MHLTIKNSPSLQKKHRIERSIGKHWALQWDCARRAGSDCPVNGENRNSLQSHKTINKNGSSHLWKRFVSTDTRFSAAEGTSYKSYQRTVDHQPTTLRSDCESIIRGKNEKQMKSIVYDFKLFSAFFRFSDQPSILRIFHCYRIGCYVHCRIFWPFQYRKPCGTSPSYSFQRPLIWI